LEVLVATTDADGPERLPVPLGRTIEYRDVPAIFFRRQWSEAFKYSRPLAMWLKQSVGQFDVVHIHAVFSHASVAAAAAARNSRVPYVVRPLGSLNPWALSHKPWRKSILLHAGAGRMLHQAQAIHYTSHAERDHSEAALGLRRGIVIPLGISLPEFDDRDHTPTNRWPARPSVHPYVLVLGRLHPVKGLELLIDAFVEVARSRFPEWRMKVVGDGEGAYVEDLKRRVRHARAEDLIEFCGWLEGEAKESALCDAQLLAMPSRQENFGLAAFEALARGVAVLVSDQIDLAREIDVAGAGWVTRLDRHALTDTLADALANESARKACGRAGQALVRHRFAWPTIASQLEQLYRSMAARPCMGE
jgi:glycosyltransferase involved in cell wall biosynthesis